MLKQLRTSHLLLLTLLLLLGCFTYKRRVFQHNKKTLIEKLEAYKIDRGVYPKDLTQLGISLDKTFYYTTDSLQQCFTLAYSSGLMDVNTNQYDSRSQQWTETFSY